MVATPIETLLAPDFLVGLTSVPLPEVRSRRAVCQEVEVGLSYLRRMVQGRLDIVLAELARRTSGESAGDVANLVDRLPSILADNVHAPGNGRLPTLMTPTLDELDVGFTSRLDAIVDANELAALSDREVDEVHAVADSLHQLEKDISAQRRSLHERIDVLQEEIVRRYKTGEATVDTLLA